MDILKQYGSYVSVFLFLLTPGAQAATCDLLSKENKIQSISFEYFSLPVTLRYPSDFQSPFVHKVSEKSISKYYHILKATQYEHLIRDLRYFRNTLGLSDWLFYKLIYKAVDKIFGRHAIIEKELASWFILTELGFDTRVTYLPNKVFICVYSEDKLYEIPLIRDANRVYANLTSFRKGYNAQNEELFLLNFRPKENRFPFSFYFQYHAALPNDIITRQVEFSFQGRRYEINLEIDRTVIQIMKDYPYFAEDQYLKVPLSAVAYQSLIPQLQKALEGKSPLASIQLLATFTRSSFEYKEDKTFFGKSKPMIADEVLYYPFSDCEDRSALFYQLIKNLMNLPMVAIAFDDHLTIGIESDELHGEYVRFNDRKYYVCDPTGPSNSETVGKFPKGYSDKAYEIISAYK